MNILGPLYIIIGIIIAYIDWHYNIKTMYYITKNTQKCEDEMLLIYWAYLIILWPLYVIIKLFQKIWKQLI